MNDMMQPHRWVCICKAALFPDAAYGERCWLRKMGSGALENELFERDHAYKLR